MTATSGTAPSKPTDLLDVLAAERDIRHRMHQFCRGVNALDLALAASAWHPDGTLDFEDPPVRGAAVQLLGRVIEGYAEFDARFLQDCSSIISITGNGAVSETYTLELLRTGVAGSQAFVDTHRRGRFLDRWSLRDGQWRLEHRQAVRSLEWRQPVDQTGTPAHAAQAEG